MFYHIFVLGALIFADQLKEILDKRFAGIMDANLLDFDPIFFIAAALDPNTAYQLTDADFNVAVSSIINVV